jgi:hypothetical protein
MQALDDREQMLRVARSQMGEAAFVAALGDLRDQKLAQLLRDSPEAAEAADELLRRHNEAVLERKLMERDGAVIRGRLEGELPEHEARKYAAAAMAAATQANLDPDPEQTLRAMAMAEARAKAEGAISEYETIRDGGNEGE